MATAKRIIMRQKSKPPKDFAKENTQERLKMLGQPPAKVQSVQIDRFEEGFAVLYDKGKKVADLPRGGFPSEAKAGDFLDVVIGSNGIAVHGISKDSTLRRNLLKRSIRLTEARAGYKPRR